MAKRSRRTGLLVVAIGFVAWVAGVAWAFASPIGSAPDDDYHNTSIWCPPPVDSSGCVVQRNEAGEVVTVQVPTMVAGSACEAFHGDVSAGCLSGLSDTVTTMTGRYDRGEYPGPYYRFMHVFVGTDAARSVLVMRIVNVTIAVLLLGALLACATPQGRALTAYAFLGSMVPLGMFIVASVNPSTWAVIGVPATALALHVATSARVGWSRWGAVAVAVVAALLAALARGDSGAYLVVVATAVLVLNAGRRIVSVGRLLPYAAVCLIGVVSFLSARQTGVLTSAADQMPRSPSAVLLNNLLDLPNLLAGGYGFWGLGWLDTTMPSIVPLGTYAVACGLVMLGLSRLTIRKALALALVVAVLVVLPLLLLQRGLYTVGEWVQPRYLLPLLPVALAVLLVGERADRTLLLRGAQPAVAVILLTVANSVALMSTIRRYVTGDDGSYRLGQNAEWWWSFGPSPMVTWVLGSLAFAGLAGSLWWVSRPARLPAAEPSGAYSPQ